MTEQIEPAPGTGSFTMEGLPEGPWILESNSCGGFSILDPQHRVLCQRGDWPHNAAQSLAIARAIASIPDMIAEIENLRKAAKLYKCENERLKGIENRERFLTKRLAERSTELESLRAINAELCEALEKTIRRLEVCARQHGNDEEIVQIATAEARAILAKAARGGAGAP
jgi:hypothetical protein